MLGMARPAGAQPLRMRAGQRLTWSRLGRALAVSVDSGVAASGGIAVTSPAGIRARRVGQTTLTLKTAGHRTVSLTLTVGAGELAGSVGSIYLYPSGLSGSIRPDTSKDFDLGGNSWWLRDWGAFAAAQTRDLADLRELYDDNPRTLLIVYFPLYLADTNYGGTYLDELETLLQWYNDHGVETMLFIGRPDYYYTGTTTQGYRDPINDATQQGYVVSGIQNILGHGAISSLVHLVSVYYLGLVPTSQVVHAEADVLTYNRLLKTTINAFGPAGVACPGDSRCLRYIEHVDGPFWEAGYSNPASWNENGYTPASISPGNSASDGLMAESWVQGSLPGGLAYLLGNGYFSSSQIMLINDIPNCDNSAVASLSGGACATGDHASAGAVVSDNALWFSWFRGAGLSAWSRWDFDDAASTDVNAYGALNSAGTAMTVNGHEQQRHAGIFLGDFEP